jgi:hypothetical protein
MILRMIASTEIFALNKKALKNDSYGTLFRCKGLQRLILLLLTLPYGFQHLNVLCILVGISTVHVILGGPA